MTFHNLILSSLIAGSALSVASLAQSSNCPVMVDDILELTQPPQQQTASGNGHSAINPFLQPGTKSKPPSGAGRIVMLKHTFRHRRLLSLHDDHLHVDHTNTHTLHEHQLTNLNTLTQTTTLASETVDPLASYKSNDGQMIDSRKDDNLESTPTSSYSTNERVNLKVSGQNVDNPNGTGTDKQSANELIFSVADSSNLTKTIANESLQLAMSLFNSSPNEQTINYQASFVNKHNRGDHIAIHRRFSDSNSSSSPARQIVSTVIGEEESENELLQSSITQQPRNASEWKFHALDSTSEPSSKGEECTDCGPSNAPTEEEVTVLTTTMANYYQREAPQWAAVKESAQWSDVQAEEGTVLINTSSREHASVGGTVEVTTTVASMPIKSRAQWRISAPNGTLLPAERHQSKLLAVADTTSNGANLSRTTLTATSDCNSQMSQNRSLRINSVALPISFGRPNRQLNAAKDAPYGERTLPMRDRLDLPASHLMMSNWQRYHSLMLSSTENPNDLREQMMSDSLPPQKNFSRKSIQPASQVWSFIRYLRERLFREQRRHRRLVMRSIVSLMQSTLEQDVESKDDELFLHYLITSLMKSAVPVSGLQLTSKIFNINSNSRSARSKPTVSVDSQTIDYQVNNDIYTTDNLHVNNTNNDDNFVINLLQEESNSVDAVSSSPSRKCMFCLVCFLSFCFNLISFSF